METELRDVMQILSLLCSWWCIWLGTLQNFRHLLVLNVCVCRYSRICDTCLTSRMNTFKSVNSRYFISEGGPHEAVSADSFVQLLPWPPFKSIQLFEPLLFLQLYFVFSLVRSPCGFQVQTSFRVAEESFLSVPDQLTFLPFGMRVHTGPSLR
jgi:hypothetical protein